MKWDDGVAVASARPYANHLLQLYALDIMPAAWYWLLPFLDNHTSSSLLSFCRLDALTATQPTASKHWRHHILCILLYVMYIQYNVYVLHQLRCLEVFLYLLYAAWVGLWILFYFNDLVLLKDLRTQNSAADWCRWYAVWICARVMKYMEYHVEGARTRGRPKKTWREIVEKDCQARKLNNEDAMDLDRWRKQIRDDWWPW